MKSMANAMVRSDLDEVMVKIWVKCEGPHFVEAD